MGSTSPLDMKHVEEKLQSLSNTRESIQSLSMWALSHKAQHEEIVAIWFQVLKTAKIELRLCLFYLCNDIVQTCRREHALVFKDAFKEVLKDAALLVRDASVRSNVKRIFKIWLERKVYDEAFVKELLATLHNTKVKSSLNSKLLAGFHPENLKKSLSEMVETEEKMEQQCTELPDHIWDKEEVETFKQEMKNRSQGEEVVMELEKMRSVYREYVASLEEERYQRKDLILMLELSELFFDAQMGECNILSTAYKAYSTKINAVKKRLLDLVHPDNKDTDQQKKRKKNKTKLVYEDSKCEPSVVDNNRAPMPDSMNSSPALSLEKRPNATITIAAEMGEQPIFQKFHSDRHADAEQDGPNFRQLQVVHQQDPNQHRPIQQQLQMHQQQQQLQPSTSYSANASTVKSTMAVTDDCYEMNYYEIGGEECTPVFDEEALEGGDGTPVQDEDPSDGYFPAKDRKGSYPETDLSSSENSVSKTGRFVGVAMNPPPGSSGPMTSLNPHVPFPLGCMPPDLTRPPPPLNIFFSPSGAMRGANPNAVEKDNSVGDVSLGQGVRSQVVPMPSGMFPIVGLPMCSSASISSPTLPPFGMMPYAGTIITTQQSVQTPPNFPHLLPNVGQVSLVSQLSVPPPGLQFQQQLISSPLVGPSLQAVQLQNSQQQPQHLNLSNFSGRMNSNSLLIQDDKKSLDFPSKHPLPASSSSSVPTKETRYQSSAVAGKEYCNPSRVLTRAPDLFSEGNSVDAKGSRLRVNQKNLTQVKTIDDMHAPHYSSLGT